MLSSYSRSFYSVTIYVYSTHTGSTILGIYRGRSVRLDILAVDEKNHVYNIEVQRNDKGAGVKRARYNSSLIDDIADIVQMTVDEIKALDKSKPA